MRTNRVHITESNAKVAAEHLVTLDELRAEYKAIMARLENALANELLVTEHVSTTGTIPHGFDLYAG